MYVVSKIVYQTQTKTWVDKVPTQEIKPYENQISVSPVVYMTTAHRETFVS